MSSADAGELVVEVEQGAPMRLQGRFRCGARQLLALVGPSGAGKTSMLRVLAGLMKPVHGLVQLGDTLWCDSARGIFIAPQARHVGLVFQHYALMPHLSAHDNVALSLLHLPRAERQARAAHWLDRVRLSRAEQQRRPADLSGGQQQRVGVARALAREPRLVLLDEPFAAVDQMNREGLYTLLADLRRELAVPMVLVTHDLNEARLLADRLVVMDAGQVLQEGTPQGIAQAPRNARVAEMMGLRNHFQGLWLGPGTGSGQGLLRWLLPGVAAQRCPQLQVRDKGRLGAGQAVSWVLPGDGVSLVHPVADASAPPGGARLAARVVELQALGEVSLATLCLQDWPTAQLHVMVAGPQQRELSPGLALDVVLDASRVHVMPVKANQPSRA